MLVPPICPVVTRPLIDLPHPFSGGAIKKLKLADEQRARYHGVWSVARNHGIPAGLEGYCSFSKLLGWPALVRGRDVDQIEFNQPKKKIRLLLQVDDYRNGDKSHGWGPGGSLYFALPERGLLARNYAACEFDIQFT
jgi:hypothetical protein